jgi:ABC-type oligopeptide transport system ATPase subunit
VLNLISDMVQDLALTLVFDSHDLSVVGHVCDRAAVMHQGQIVATGSTREVYDHPQHPYTRELVPAVPSLRRALAEASAADLGATTVGKVVAGTIG